MTLEYFHSSVSSWFLKSFSSTTAVQAKAWPLIIERQNTLLAAPTGSGKTLAAFLASINQLICEGLTKPLPDETRILYISPLKALSNDIQKNLQEPLAGIQEQLRAMGLPAINITAWVRTGDTPQSERQKAAKCPPHIVVTTPETVYLLLTSNSGRNMLKTVDTVIVDEIHALAGNKRGAHLSLSLARLDRLSPHKKIRIGLSATQKPIATIANFLVGSDKDCSIIDTGHRRERDLQLHLPQSPLEAIMAGEVWSEVYDHLAQLIKQHKTTLIFVNTRRLAERLAKNLSERLDETAVTSHHGSLAKEHRLNAEQRLKAGTLKCLVATASLELGIDIGDIDLVCQMGSPKSIAAFLQRVGRSGHGVGMIPKGYLFPLTRDDLVECAALFKAIKDDQLDQVHIPRAPLDVLAQQIIAEVAANEECSEHTLFNHFVTAWPYRELTFATFKSVIKMLADGYSTRRGRHSAYLHYDGVNGKLRPKKGARLAASTNGGTIPDQFDYEVILSPEDIRIGTLNEDFAFESLPGDIFQLGNTSYRILKVEQRRGQVIVADAQGEPPNLPFWLGEAPGRSDELSRAVSDLRDKLNHLFDQDQQQATVWLEQTCGISKEAAQQLSLYMHATKTALGHIPTQSHVVVERFFDDTGDMHFVIHSPYGSRLNRAWGLALRKKFCRRFNFELQAAALEDTIILSLSVSHSFPITEPMAYVKSQTAEETLVQALLDAPMFPTHWRWVATTALAVKRTIKGKRAPAYFQRNNAEDLIALLFPDQIACAENLAGQREVPDHPLVTQTIHDCLHDVMDVDGFVNVLKQLEGNNIQVTGRDLHTPSPLAQEVITAKPYAFLDDAPAEERRVLAIKSRSMLDPENVSDLSIIDPLAIDKVKQEIWPIASNADELHDAMVLLGFLVVNEVTPSDHEFFSELQAAHRATALQTTQQTLWVAAERLHEFGLINNAFIGQSSIKPLVSTEQAQFTEQDALKEIIRSRLEGLGPTTADQLAQPLALATQAIDSVLIALENEGFVVRGQFDQRDTNTTLQWCERRVLARMHRYTISQLRKAITPASPSQLMRFLFQWQHVSETKEGIDALADVVAQLEGFSAAASAWEGAILPARLARYQASDLDSLCHSGQITWRRLNAPDKLDKRSQLINTTPIALVNRQHLSLWQHCVLERNDTLSSSAQALVAILQDKGACFFSDLVAYSGMLRSQIEISLGELVSKGWVSSDNFEGLRALIAPASKRPKRRRQPLHRAAGSRFDLAGRWSIFGTQAGNEEKPETLTSRSIEQLALTFLHRYGIVFRKLLEREAHLPPWRELLKVYWRLEARGEIRGGRFVQGFSGEQFALPDALSQLRKLAKAPKDEQYLIIDSSDPLNLLGIILPGNKIPSHSHQRILFNNGVAIATEHHGEIVLLESTSMTADIQRLFHNQKRLRHQANLLSNQTRFLH